MVRLSDMEVLGNCRVLKLTGSRTVKKRLLEMGFVKGTDILVEKVAPLGDPMELVLKGYHLSLRRNEAHDVYVERYDGSRREEYAGYKRDSGKPGTQRPSETDQGRNFRKPEFR